MCGISVFVLEVNNTTVHQHNVHWNLSITYTSGLKGVQYSEGLAILFSYGLWDYNSWLYDVNGSV